MKKQRHTAKRIYDRLVEETGFTGGESTIRAKVHELKQLMPSAFLPLLFDPGEALQVDWGEAFVYIKGKREKVNLFCARLCNSCRPVVLAYHRQNEESFLDAFVRSFQVLDGTPAKVIFDNGKVTVKDGFGSHAKKQEGYTHLSAHYGFNALFCNPAEGHEKGLVEGLVGWARRNILVPVPRVDSLTELNEALLERCQKYEAHRIQGRPDTVGAMYRLELDLSRYDGKISDLFIGELASCRFIREKKNIIMLGNPGRGKTHMAIGLALKACSLGMNVLFKNAASLSTELSEARDNYVLGKLEKRIRKADLLILDEMGYVSFDRYQSELLFKVIADRSERGSIIVTTNLPFSEWTTRFENTAMVAAMVDRLTFQS